jgi:hypothetical protein
MKNVVKNVLPDNEFVMEDDILKRIITVWIFVSNFELSLELRRFCQHELDFSMKVI